MKLIFLDVDGTLTQPGENTPPDSALNAIKRSQEKGNKVFLCTGRNPDMLMPLLKYNFDGMIASAGGYVALKSVDYEVQEASLKYYNEILYNLPMTNQQRDTALEALHKNGVFCTLEGVSGSWGDENLDEFLKDQPKGNSEIERWRKVLSSNLKIRPMSEYDGSLIHKIVVMCNKLEQLDEARALLENDFNFVIHETPPGINCVNCELINKKFNKGTGVKLIREKFNVELENSFGFGDSMNDLEMMREVGTSVCMESGAEGLKKLVNKICPAVEDNGIARMFEDLKLV